MEVKIHAEPIKKEEKKGFDEWEIDSAVHCLVRAEEIKQDAKLMAACREHLSKKKKAINSIAQLEEKARKMDRGEKD